MSQFYKEVDLERANQISKWGNSDHLNDVYNWGAYINAYASRSLIGFPGLTEERKAAFKADMVKVAALAKAAYETL